MEQFIAQKDTQIEKKQRAKEYLLHYLSELKLHFNLNDEDVIKFLKKTYFELHKGSIVQKWLCVVKSFLRK